MVTKPKGRTMAKKHGFHQELVLDRWVLDFFQGGTLAALKMRLGDDRFESIDEDGQQRCWQSAGWPRPVGPCHDGVAGRMRENNEG